MSIVLAMLVSGSALAAQAPDPALQALLKAAITLRTFDHFAQACERAAGFTPAEARAIAAWRAAQRVELVRGRVADAERAPGTRQAVDQAVRSIASRLQGQQLSDCALAVSVTRTDEAQFVAVAPDLASGPAPDAPGTVTSPPASTPSPTLAPAAPRSDPAILAAIDSFAFDTRPIMGIGGFITTDIYPIVLFKNGDVLAEVAGLMFPGGLAAHRRAHPDQWTRWQRTGAELQILEAKGWATLPFPTTYGALPDGFGLDGLFRRLSGVGTMGVGGSDAVTAFNEYRFHPDGRVERGGGVGGRSEFGDTSTVTRGVAPDRRGTYRIEGLQLRITYDDGSTEQRLLITDPKDPKGAIWLDGHSYVQRR